MEEFIRVPQARIGAIIGKEGKTKHEIEEKLNITIEIDTESGQTHIFCKDPAEDPLCVWKGRDIIRAIARGFSPQKALDLLEDGYVLEIIDLGDYFGKSNHTLTRVKGRIIGKNGMTRKIIETMTGARVSVYGRTVALIGEFNELADARKAVEMLLSGCMHATVYKFLEHINRQRKMEEQQGLWK
jgi:ribosomal RNA assembly protein